MEGNNENISMGKLLIQFFAQVQKYGLLITLLVVINGVTIKLYSDTQVKVDKCLESQISDLKTERKELVEVLKEVKIVLREQTRTLYDGFPEPVLVSDNQLEVTSGTVRAYYADPFFTTQ